MRSSLRIARLAIVFSFMIVGCQQSEDPNLNQNSGNPVLIRAANGALYSARCIKTRGLRALSTCGVSRAMRGGRAATVVPDSTSTASQYTVYSPTQYPQQSFCPYMTGSQNCYQAFGYQTNQYGYAYNGQNGQQQATGNSPYYGGPGTATYQGSTEQGYSTQGTMCTVCMGSSNYNCQQRSCFWNVPGYSDTQVYNQTSGSFTVGDGYNTGGYSTGGYTGGYTTGGSTTGTTGSTVMGNWVATDGTGGAIQFASGSYIRTSNSAAGESGSYTSDGINVQFSPSAGTPYSCTASYPSSTQLSLLCTQNGVTTGYFYSRQY